LDGSIPVSRFGDLQSKLAHHIAQQASQVGVVLDYQHQLPVVVVLKGHVFLSSGCGANPQSHLGTQLSCHDTIS
jgi:hypothetical protein